MMMNLSNSTMKSMFPMRHKQSGSMLVLALFIIIVMTMLGLSMTTLMSSSADAVIYEVYGLRARNAARIGLEQSLQAVFSTTPASVAGCTAASRSFDGVAGLKNCKFESSCTTKNYNFEDGSATTFYFSSTGSCDGGQITVSRTLEVDALERQ